MADADARVRIVVTDEGTLGIIDDAGRKVTELGTRATDLTTKVAGTSQAFGALKTVLAGFGVGIGFAGVIQGVRAMRDAIGGTIAEAIEAQDSVRRLNTVLQSTGQFSQSYSRELLNLASNLQQVTRYGDDAVIGAEALLLTFTKVGRDIFPQALEAILNVSTAMRQDLQSATIQVGKALNDPILGLTALSRSGIQFTETQKNTIKSLVDTGKVAEAQKIILAELSTQFGGQARAAAETFAGALDQVGNATGDLRESIGSIVTESPFLIDLLHNARDAAGEAAENTAKWVTENRALIDSKFDSFVSDLKEVRDTYVEIREAIESLPSPFPFTDTSQGFGSNLQGLLLGRTPAEQEFLRNLLGRGQGPFSGGSGFRGGAGGEFPILPPRITEDFFSIQSPRASGGTGGTDKAALAAARAEARALAEAAKDAADSAQAYVVAQQSGLEVAKAQLAVAEDLGASQQEQLALAQQVDLAEKAVLDAQIGVLGAKIEAVGEAGGELDLLLAQVDALGAQKDIIEQTGGEAAKLTREFEEQRLKLLESKQVVFDLGRELNTSIQRAVDGLLQGGNGQKLGDVLKGTGKALASSFIGGLIEAELAKNSFDAKIGENFTVTLPGFMQTGADAITNIWSGAMDLLTGSTGTATRDIGTQFAQVGNQLQGLSRNTPGFGAAFGDIGSAFSQVGASTQIESAAGSSAVTDAFGNVLGFQNLASGAGSSAAGASGATGGAGAGGGGLGGLGAIGGIITLATIAIDTIKGVSEAAAKEAKRFGATDASVRVEAAKQLPLLNYLIEFADKVGVLDNALENSTIANFLLPGFGFFGAPGPITQVKSVLRDALQEAGVPEQQIFHAGGSRGVRAEEISRPVTDADVELFRQLGFRSGDIAQSVESNAVQDFNRRNILSTGPGSSGKLLDLLKDRNPEVDKLRFGGAFGVLSAAFGGDVSDKQLLATVNAFTNNLLLLGYTEDEARRETVRFAESLNINLISGLDAVQKKFAETKNRTQADIDQLLAAATGIIDIFSDKVPPGVDLAAIAIENFSERAGLAVGEFQKDAERAVEIFGNLQEASNQGLRGGLGAGIQAGATHRNLLDDFLAGRGGVTFPDVAKAGRRATGEFLSPLIDSIRDGMTTAITEGVFDAVKDTPAWEALQNQIADAVKGGDIGSISGLVGDVVGASLQQLNTAAEVVAQINEQFGITPAALFGSAEGIRNQVEGERFGALSRRDQEADIRKRLGLNQSEIDALLVGGITEDERTRFADLQRERSQLGFDFADVASQRFAPGSRAEAIARERGLSIAEDAADALEKFGFEVNDSFTSVTEVTTSNTTATQENTAALRYVGEAIEKGIGTGQIQITIDGGDGLDAQGIGTLVTSQLGNFLRSSTGQALIREAVNVQ